MTVHYHAVMDRRPLASDRQSVPLTPAAALSSRGEARAAVRTWRESLAAAGWTVTGNDDDCLAAAAGGTYRGAAVETCWRNHR